MRISAIIAAYNAERSILRALQSALAQTEPCYEIIVIDDHSSDSTAGIVQNLQSMYPNLKLIMNQANLGPSASRNLGIQAASGTWIAILDADDAWHRDRNRNIANIARSGTADIILDNLLLFDESADRMSGTALLETHRVTPVSLGDIVSAEIEEDRFRLGFLKPVISLDFLRSNCLEYNTDMRLSEDLYLLIESLLIGGRVMLSHLALYIYTEQRGSVSKIKSTLSKSPAVSEHRFNMATMLMLKYGRSVNRKCRAILRKFDKYLLYKRISTEAALYRRNGSINKLIALSVCHPLMFSRFLVVRIFRLTR